MVRAYCGHGVGDLFHCAPNVPHYAGNKAVGLMKPGHVFTIEARTTCGLLFVYTLLILSNLTVSVQLTFYKPPHTLNSRSR